MGTAIGQTIVTALHPARRDEWLIRENAGRDCGQARGGEKCHGEARRPTGGELPLFDVDAASDWVRALLRSWNVVDAWIFLPVFQAPQWGLLVIRDYLLSGKPDRHRRNLLPHWSSQAVQTVLRFGPFVCHCHILGVPLHDSLLGPGGREVHSQCSSGHLHHPFVHFTARRIYMV